MVKKLLDIKEVAEYIGVSVNTVYSWIWQKKVPYIKLGKLVKFDSAEIDRWLVKKSVRCTNWDRFLTLR